jgi:hypothetical protein
MLQLRAGDLVSIQKADVSVTFAILTRQILFGGHWSFVFYVGETELLDPGDSDCIGFNAFVDFIVPKREERITRKARGNDFSQLVGPELLNQQPLKGETNYRIWRWRRNKREEVEYVRFTPQPTAAELHSPYYGCLQADFVCDLSARHWKVGTSLWVA